MPERSVLHILLDITETSMPYNEIALKQTADHEISIGTYLKPGRETDRVRVLPGDGTLRGFYRMLKDELARGRTDLLHVHSPHTGAFISLAKPLLGRNFPAAVLTVHNSFENYKLRNKLFLFLAFRGFSRVIFCSRASCDSFPPVYKRLANGRMGVIQNGLDLDRVDGVIDLRQKSFSGDRLKIISIGRLVPLKNFETLLRAAAHVGSRSVEITLIGKGRRKDQLMRMARSLEIDDRVHFTGLIPREEVYRSLFAADVFVSPSRGEGLPIAVMEAMACGLPVILSDIAPHRELARGADFMPLLDAEDFRGFAEQIRRHAKMKPEALAALGRACRRQVEENFSLRAMLRRYDRLYRELGSSG